MHGGPIRWSDERPTAHFQEKLVTLRCTLDGLLLPAMLDEDRSILIAYDGDEPFEMDRCEAVFYELVAASREEIRRLQAARYRLLSMAEDFAVVGND